jgi:integrase
MRKRSGERGLFEYRDQWIGQEAGREGFYRYWYDVGSRRVKRKALASVDLGEAKEELIKLLGAPIPSASHPSEVYLFDVLKHYQDNYAEPKGYKQMAAARRASELADAAFMSFMASSPKVSDLTRTSQRRVWSHMAATHGLSAKSIMTYMIAIRAAVNYSAKPQIILVDEKQVEVQLLDSAPTIFCNQEEIAEIIGGSVSVAREFIPTYEQLGKWIDAIEEEDDFRYVMIALNTCARNEAIFDLVISKQVNQEVGTIDLNPIGRRQTKKRRPVIRLTTNLAAWFDHWGDDKPVRQYQDTVEKRLNRMGKRENEFDKEGKQVWKALKLPEMTCYTLRHFMATNMRRASFPVSREQRSKWLGHSVTEGSKTTDWYEKFDPDYLEEPMRATDEIMANLQKFTTRRVLAPTMHPQGNLRLAASNDIK